MNVLGHPLVPLQRSDFAQGLAWICQANKQIRPLRNDGIP